MKYISVILIIIIYHITAYAQRNISLPFSTSYNEHALISFGIQYNYVYQKYLVRLKENWQQDYPIDYPKEDILYLGNLKSIQSKPGSGFSVGIPIDIRIHQFISINATPSFLFINNLGITYESSDMALAPLVRKARHTISSIDGKNFNALEVPIHIKWSSEEKGNSFKENRYRGYFTTGIRYTKWLGLQKAYFTDNNVSRNSSIVQRKEYFSWEVGLGIDILFDTFKISPELKFSQSFHNVLDNTSRLSLNNKFMTPIEKALIRNIYFGLIFQ